METNQKISSPGDDDGGTFVNQSAAADVSSGDNNNQHIKPEESTDQAAADDVSFGINHLQIGANDDSNSRELMRESPETDFDAEEVGEDDDVSSGDDNNQHIKPDDSADQAAADDGSFGFNHLQIGANDDSNSRELMRESPETDFDDEEEEDDDDVEGDFTFPCVGDNGSPDGYETGQIRTVFPLFDQSLLSGGDYDDGKKLKLPIDVPVNKIFIESPSSNGETAGTVQALSDGTGSGSPEMKMKSNSTGFSKLWRIRNEMNRSNSDSRDSFVFLESSNRTGGKSTEKVNVPGGKGKAVKKGLNSKKPAASAHEVYLKQKGGQPEEHRRSYLPYRPGLMGFFTNASGGLSKNVHPF